MQKAKLKVLLAVLALLLLMNAPLTATVNALQPKQETNTTLSYDIYVEGIDILYGENGAVAATVNIIGGNMSIGFDINDPAFDHLEFMWISFGKGLDWTRYIHKPLWRYPAGVQLVLGYKVTFGFSEDDAIQSGFDAARIIGKAYGLKLYVMWEEYKNGIVTMIFYALMDEEEFDTFFENNFTKILGDEGFGSYVTPQAIRDSPYARLILAISRDREDLDRDGDKLEYVPIAGAGFIAEDAVVPDGDDYYKISLNNIFQRIGNITWHPDSLFSAITVKIPFPVILDRNASTPTNSSFPAVTGKYEYILHAKDPASLWEYNWPTPLDDIVIRFKPYNYTELATKFPIIQAKFYADPYPDGGSVTSITLTLEVTNIGTTTAYHTHAIIPLEREDYERLRLLQILGILNSTGWKLKHIRTPRGERYLLLAPIGDLSPNATQTARITLDLGATDQSGIVPFFFGPIVAYTDEKGIRYSVLANGIAYPFNGANNSGTFIIPEIYVSTPTGESYVEVGKSVTISVNITNFGGMPAKDINVTVIHAIVDEHGNIIEMRPIDEYHVSELKGIPNQINECSALFETIYQVRTRPGMHLVGAIIEYKGAYVKYAHNNTIEEFNAVIMTNLMSMFVLPPYRVRGRIFRYPLPHAELSVNKTLEFDNETGLITVRLTITNIGDYPTQIMHIVDYWNASQVEFIADSVKVNGTVSTTAGAFINNKIGVVYVVIANRENPISLGVNETIVVEYQLNVTPRNTTFELVSHPTIVLYDFGPYEMVREEQPIREEEGEGSEGEQVYVRAIRILQETTESQPVETFTQAIIQVISTILPPKPGPGEGEEGGAVTPPPPSRIGFILLLAIIAVVIATVSLARRRR